MRRKAGFREKLNQMEYEAAGKSRRLTAIQKSMNELNTAIKKIEIKKGRKQNG